MQQIYDVYRISYRKGKKICEWVNGKTFREDAEKLREELENRALQENRPERYEVRMYTE